MALLGAAIVANKASRRETLKIGLRVHASQNTRKTNRILEIFSVVMNLFVLGHSGILMLLPYAVLELKYLNAKAVFTRHTGTKVIFF